MKGAVLSILIINMIIGQMTTIATKAPDMIDYTCSTDGTIQIKTQTLVGYRIAVGPYNNNGTLEIGQTNNDGSNCIVGMKQMPQQPIALSKCNLTKPVYVYLMNANETQIIGGKNFHEYKLTCSIPDKGLNMSVTASQLNIGNMISATPETNSYSVSLQMSITPSSSVYIGDKLKLLIKIEPPATQELFILPRKCIAKPVGVGKTRVTLMNNGYTTDSNVLGKFTVGNNQNSSADMYAFRFVESANVEIDCDVTVCKNKLCVAGAYDLTSSKPTTASGRKRRSAQEDISGETFEVSGSFQIGEKETENQDSGQCNVRWNPTIVISLLLVTVTAFIRKT